MESRHNLSQLSWKVTNIQMGKYFVLEVQELSEFANKQQQTSSKLLFGTWIVGWSDCWLAG